MLLLMLLVMLGLRVRGVETVIVTVIGHSLFVEIRLERWFSNQSSEKRVDKQETTEQLSTKRLQIAYPVIRSFLSICRIARIRL